MFQIKSQAVSPPSKEIAVIPKTKSCYVYENIDWLIDETDATDQCDSESEEFNFETEQVIIRSADRDYVS